MRLTVHFGCRKYGLEDDTIDFIGHALALHLDDSYLDQPAYDFVKRIRVSLSPIFEYYPAFQFYDNSISYIQRQ